MFASFWFVQLAGKNEQLQVVINGLVLPTIACVARTLGLYHTMPMAQNLMIKYGQAHVDRVSGEVATAVETSLTQAAVTMMFQSSTSSAALGSALLYLLVEVAIKAMWVPYLEWYYSNDPETLKTEKKFLEVRIVYEAVGEKICIMIGPFFAYALSQAVRSDDGGDDDDTATPSELAEIAGVYLAMEEVVDMLGLVVMASRSIYALRVRPQLSLRAAFSQGALHRCTAFGMMKVSVLTLGA